MQKRIILAITALLVLSLVPGVTAQTNSLSGQVLDQNGAPVADVAVSLYQWSYSQSDEICEPEGPCRVPPQGESHQAETVTDKDGRYTLPAMSGWANLNFYKDGFAARYESLEVTGEQVLDVKMMQYPTKDARITGTITGAGAVLPYVSVSAENPVYGLYECSVIEGDDNGGPVMYVDAKPAEASASGDAETSSATIAPGEPYPGYQGCAITLQKDGSFDGLVTPGYTILRFYHQDWRQEGGPQYYSKSLVRDLPANATTKLDIDLKARPMPDAILEGYIVDGATKQAIPGVYVSFGNMDNYGWASAQTDKEGSYKVKLREGLVQVSVYADGYLPWEGDVLAVAGGAVRFDVHLTAGQSQYGGGCCIAYADGAKSLGAPEASPTPAAPTMAGSPSNAGDDAEGSAAEFSDLGGGLGPYDASRAPQSGDADAGAPAVKDVPGFEIIAIALGLFAVVLLRRK